MNSINSIAISIIYKIINIIQKKRRKKYLDKLIKNGLVLGRNVDIVDTFFFDPSHCFLISIGDNCTICPNVRLIAHDASTKKNLGYTKIGKICIQENVFLGDSVIILPGVCVGANSIVGAGSIVTKDIPPNSVVAGNPAIVLGTAEAYRNKIAQIREKKKVFGREYYIEKLNERKREEILESIDDSFGFIV